MLLALDLATRVGWALGPVEQDALPATGLLDLPPRDGDALGCFFSTFSAWLAGLIAQHEPQDVVFEAPVLPRFTSLQATRKLQGLAAVAELTCFRAGVPCSEVGPHEVKKALTGSGRAKKPEMVAAARAFGLEPKAHDEADAFGVWLAAARALYPAEAWRWDPIQRRAAA